VFSRAEPLWNVDGRTVGAFGKEPSEGFSCHAAQVDAVLDNGPRWIQDQEVG